MKLNLMYSYILWCVFIACVWSVSHYFVDGTTPAATDVLIVGFAFTWAHHEQKKKDS